MAIKVLLVDDEENFQRVINQVLKRQIKNEKYEFSFATTGKQALEKISSGLQVDVALVDIRMPEMDGLTLIEELNKRPNPINSVIVSAYADIPNVRRAMKAKVMDFLVKPIEIPELEEAIDKAFSIKKQSEKSAKPTESKQAKKIKSLLSNPTSQQVTQRIAYEIVRQLPIEKQLRVMSRLIEAFSFEELSDLKYNIETQEVLLIDKQESINDLAVEVYQNLEFDEAKLPLIALEKGFIEERVIKKTLRAGDLKDYGVHLYLRWKEEGNIEKSIYLGPAHSLDDRTKALLVLLNYSPNKAKSVLNLDSSSDRTESPKKI